MFIVDLEHILKVLPPPPTAVSHCQPHRVVGRGLHMTASLRWGDFRGGSWGNIWCCPLCTPGATGRLASVTPSSGLLPPTVLSGLTSCGGSSVRGGVKCDSPPSGLSWWLYRLLIWSCSLARSWLMEWRCHLGGGGTDIGGALACWAGAYGPSTSCTLACLPTALLIISDLPMLGRPWEAVGSPLDRGISGGGRLQLEKSGGVRPGGGATYPGIPTVVVLGVVMPPEEAVTPYPGVCSTTWLHVSVGACW